MHGKEYSLPRYLLWPSCSGCGYARNKANLSEADTTENNSETPHPVIGLVTEWVGQDGLKNERDKNSDLGGTMRMGAQSVILKRTQGLPDL